MGSNKLELNILLKRIELLEKCEGLLPPKHDAGTATRHYRAFWQRRYRAAAAGAALKP